MTICRRLGRRTTLPAVAAAGFLAATAIAPAAAAALPDIRLSEANPVPACATPERLMQFLKDRNGRLDPRYDDLALLYHRHGEPWRVRWDYAFFQMAVETNFLTFVRPDGRKGDVDPKQNNFAGIGTTGGGVPGDSYPDIDTGVLAHIQHLVVYSGESVAAPVAPRTQLKQESILARSRALNRPIRFSDLTGRWAADKTYDQTIARVAESFRTEHCRNRTVSRAAPAEERASPAVRTIWTRNDKPSAARPKATDQKAPETMSGDRRPAVTAPAAAAPVPPPAAEDVHERFALLAPPAFPLLAPSQRGRISSLPLPLRKNGAPRRRLDPTIPPPSGLGVRPSSCSIDAASFGGSRTILIQSGEASAPRYSVLTVLEGFEDSMTASFIKAKARGGRSIGVFASKAAAMAKARELCPGS